MSQGNQWITLWIVEHEKGGPALLLYGFASATARAIDQWRKREEEIPAPTLGSGRSLTLSQLTAVLEAKAVDQLLADLSTGALKISANRSETFSIVGKWVVRADTEAPPSQIHPYTLNLTNLAASGAATRKTAWQVSFDPLGEFLQSVAPDITLKELRASNEYLSLLDRLQAETGFDLHGDDIVQLGNFDWYRNRLDPSLSPEFSGIDFHTITEDAEGKKKVVGLRVQFSPAVLTLAPLIVKIELHSTFDRTFCRVARFDANQGESLEIKSSDLEPYCSYSVEVYREATGEAVTSEAFHIIRSIEGSMVLLGQQRSIDTPWATKQKQSQPGPSTANITKTTLHTSQPMMAATLSRDYGEDPWNFLTRRRNVLTKKRATTDKELAPVIDGVTDEKRIAPLLKILSSEQFSTAEIYDPYFDQTAVQKLLLRISAQDRHLIVYTNVGQPGEGATRTEELKTILEKAGPFLPCRVTVNTLSKSFHDRFLVLHRQEAISVFVLTNSLDKYNCAYPLFIVPLADPAARAAQAYLKSLSKADPQTPTPVSELFDSSSAHETRAKNRREALAKLSGSDTLTHLPEYGVIVQSGKLNSEGRLSDQFTSDVLESLFKTEVNYENLALLAYRGVLDNTQMDEVVPQIIAKDAEKTEALAKEIRLLAVRGLPDASDFRVLGAFQLFDTLADKRLSPDLKIASVYRDLSKLFEHLGPMYGLPNPHRILLWEWLSIAKPEEAYDLFLELRDASWVAALVGQLYWNSPFLTDFVKLARNRPDDRLLFVLSMVFVTGRPAVATPVGSPVTSFDFLSNWETQQASALKGRLGTFAALAAFGDANNQQLSSALGRLTDYWKIEAPRFDEFDDVDQLVRAGIPEMRHARVFELFKVLRRMGQNTWADKFEQRLLNSFDRHFRAKPGSFHYYHSEENPLFSACQEIIRGWTPDRRKHWLEERLSNQIVYVPNRPFLKKRNYDLFSTSVDQVSLWLLLRLAVADNAAEVEAVWVDFKTFLLPAAYLHGDFFKILNNLADHLRKTLDPSLAKDWKLVEQEARDQHCAWWPFDKT